MAKRRRKNESKQAAATVHYTMQSDKPLRLDPDFARALIGAEVSYFGIDDDSCATVARIVDADALVALIKDEHHGLVFAQWDNVAIYTAHLVRILGDLLDPGATGGPTPMLRRFVESMKQQPAIGRN